MAEPRRTRHIMLHENLSYALTRECIKALIEKGLIEVCLNNKGKSYRATQKGVEFIENYIKTIKALGSS
jgi:predicted transcriptional regulator